MRFRKLRIACSVFWGLACVLVICLWVQSHFVVDAIGETSQTPTETSGIGFISDNGTLNLVTRTTPTGRVRIASGINDGWHYKKLPIEKGSVNTFRWRRDQEGFLVRVPTLIPSVLF